MEMELEIEIEITIDSAFSKLTMYFCKHDISGQ